jgi:hypothetical protein
MLGAFERRELHMGGVGMMVAAVLGTEEVGCFGSCGMEVPVRWAMAGVWQFQRQDDCMHHQDG